MGGIPSGIPYRIPYGITYGIPWNFHGMSMETLWKLHGNSMEIPWWKSRPVEQKHWRSKKQTCGAKAEWWSKTRKYVVNHSSPYCTSLCKPQTTTNDNNKTQKQHT